MYKRASKQQAPLISAIEPEQAAWLGLPLRRGRKKHRPPPFPLQGQAPPGFRPPGPARRRRKAAMSLRAAARGALRPWALLLRERGWKAAAAAPVGSRAASDVPRDMLPGPYPKTPEERAAAARKYNMRVEDYEPYPDDGMGYGDYPKLPDRSQQERDPWYDWDHSDLRRNHGETMHWDFDMYVRTRVDTSPTVLSWHTMRNYLFGFIGFMLVMFGLGELYPSYQPVGPKQYPYNNLYLERGGDPNQTPPEVKNYEI